MVSCIALKASPMNDMVTTDHARDFLIQSYCNPLLLYLYASVFYMTLSEAWRCYVYWKVFMVHYSSCYWFVYTELSNGKLPRAHKLSCSSCSTNVVINGLDNFNTSELYCVFFVSPLICFVIHFIASFVCLWLSVCLSVCCCYGE